MIILAIIYLVVAISWLHVTVTPDFGGKWVKYTYSERAPVSEWSCWSFVPPWHSSTWGRLKGKKEHAGAPHIKIRLRDWGRSRELGRWWYCLVCVEISVPVDHQNTTSIAWKSLFIFGGKKRKKGKRVLLCCSARKKCSCTRAFWWGITWGVCALGCCKGTGCNISP